MASKSQSYPDIYLTRELWVDLGAAYLRMSMWLHEQVLAVQRANRQAYPWGDDAYQKAMDEGEKFAAGTIVPTLNVEIKSLDKDGVRDDWDVVDIPDQLISDYQELQISYSVSDTLYFNSPRAATLTLQPGFATLTIDLDQWDMPKSAFDHRLFVIQAFEFMDSVLQSAQADAQAVHDHNNRPLRVFIGHGGDSKWEVVRDYVHAEQYEVVAFESEERAGRATLDEVESMISSADVAILVMTGTDRLVDGTLLARQNVVHEIGYAQATLSRRNSIILLEEGTYEFGNIHGITQLRFPTGEIHQTKRRVLRILQDRADER